MQEVDFLHMQKRVPHYQAGVDCEVGNHVPFEFGGNSHRFQSGRCGFRIQDRP